MLILFADIDECNKDDNSCPEGGICQNSVGGYGCYYQSSNKSSLNIILIGINRLLVSIKSQLFSQKRKNYGSI